jgi:hypothetical protein
LVELSGRSIGELITKIREVDRHENRIADHEAAALLRLDVEPVCYAVFAQDLKLFGVRQRLIFALDPESGKMRLCRSAL